jgi:hypothetical protein
MRRKTIRDAVWEIAASMDLELDPAWTGIGPVWPILERMRADGACVLVKLDGGRSWPGADVYTLLVSGEPLDGIVLRGDCSDLDEGLSRIIIDYACRVWGYPNAGGF